MATIADVARAAGVSIATVSRVLSPGRTPHRVSERTAERVRAAAATLDFVPSDLARGLASRRSGLLGLIVPDLSDPHYPQVARGVEDAALGQGSAVLVCNTLGAPARLAEYLRVLRARRVDAVIVSGGSALGPAELHAVRQSGLPAVLIGRPLETEFHPWVAVDNVDAARAATLHLLAGGRRRVAHLTGSLAQTTMQDRAQGYREAIGAYGLRPRIEEAAGAAERAVAQVRSLLGGPEPPDAIFAAADRLAVAALAAARDAGLSVPLDLAVVGFDDLAIAPLLRPRLSSVQQPARDLGREAVRLALSQGADEPRREPPVVLAARLVIRDSSP